VIGYFLEKFEKTDQFNIDDLEKGFETGLASYLTPLIGPGGGATYSKKEAQSARPLSWNAL
jgi:hypothetical protein